MALSWFIWLCARLNHSASPRDLNARLLCTIHLVYYLPITSEPDLTRCVHDIIMVDEKKTMQMQPVFVASILH